MEFIKPVLNEPAVLLDESEARRFLVIADLHLGVELTLIKKGVEIPFHVQTNRLIKRLKRIIKQVKPTEIIILGDVKHSVPMISHMEWRIVPPFFEELSDIPIHIILGNHESDAQIEGLTTRNVEIHPAQGWVINLSKNGNNIKVALFHGHTWPGKELFNSDILIMAHNHPAIEFKDDLGVRTYERAWIRLHWNKIKLAKAYLSYQNIKNPKNVLKTLQEKFHVFINDKAEIIILPAFNDLLGGIPFNKKELKFIGPLLKSNSLDLDNAEVMLLDGTLLGKIKNIRPKE